ncbi:MAG: CRISPR-associated endonuclease Cas1 [Thermoanaerobaculaceae bacterium]|jgi:CRISPR-associated protein Cas1|nr:CRISPR-associated endonuclease Cas1 [Thermoanaerobaculaceae bacterium]
MSKTVAITEAGHTLHLDGQRLVLRTAGRIARVFKLAEVDQVLLFGPIETTHAALMAMLSAGIDLILLTRSGSYRGRLVGRTSRNVELRIAQYDRLRDETFALNLARSIVAGKLRAQRHLLLRSQASIADPEIAAALARLRFFAEDATTAADRETLLGIEGAAAASYWAVFGRAIKNPLFAFHRRSKRPPRDPVNACLSFGYTLLGTLIEGEVASAGLDPLLGALHRPDYGRPSLALDLLEEFRAPVVDAVTLRLVNRRQLVPDDFSSPSEAMGVDQLLVEDDAEEPGGVYLGLRGRKVFIAELFRRLRETVYYAPRTAALSLREIVRQQVYHFARVVRGEESAYVPFLSR